MEDQYIAGIATRSTGPPEETDIDLRLSSHSEAMGFAKAKRMGSGQMLPQFFHKWF